MMKRLAEYNRYSFKPFTVLKKLIERGKKFFLLFFFLHTSSNDNTKRETAIAYKPMLCADCASRFFWVGAICA